MLAVWTELSALSLMVLMMERRKHFSSWLTPPHRKDCQDLGWVDSQMNCTDSDLSWRWFETKRRCCLVGLSPSGNEWPAVGIPDGNKWLISRSKGKSVRLLWIRRSAGEGKASLHTNCDLWAMSETPPSACLVGFGHVWLMLSHSSCPYKNSVFSEIIYPQLSSGIFSFEHTGLGRQGKTEILMWL